MKIKYLGTAAAEGIPAVFCDCEICKKSRKLGGKNIRTRSQALIDGKILVDFPADTYAHSLYHNIELSKIKTCLITHSHSDHLYPAELWARSFGIAYTDNPTLTMYSAHGGYRNICDRLMEFYMDEAKRVVAKKIVPFEPFKAQGYKITPLRANHDMNSDPVIYIVEKGGKSLLYGHDTGFYPEATVEYLKNSGIKLDFVSFDCTGALAGDEKSSEGGHCNFIGVKIIRDLLRENGNITDKTVCVVNHFSHNGLATHEDMCAAAEKEGFTVAYDGLEIEF